MAMNQQELLSLNPWKRAVIKVGSALIAPDGQGCRTQYLLSIANFIINSRKQGKELILVSSGAVAAGVSTRVLPMMKRQKSIPEKQALAALGQPLLMAHWNRFFDFPCAQLLLSYDDIHNRRRFVNAKNTLRELLDWKTLPIINENDTVATEELKVGDNDNLAAHVAVLAEVDLLIICTDIDGLFDKDPKQFKNSQMLRDITEIDETISALAGGPSSSHATGGMRTKIEAAAKATSRGIDTVIVNGTKHETFEWLNEGKLYGTLFRRIKNPLAAKKHWMLHALPSQGNLIVDPGAQKAISERGASLLPSGIVGVEGHFLHGDAVLITSKSSQGNVHIAKGICQFSSADLEIIKGRQSREIEELLGYRGASVVVHRDDLVLFN